MVKSSAFFNLVLFLFLFSIFFLNAFIVGPFSIRIYVSFLVFIIFFFKSTKFKINREMVFYALFIFFYWFALNMNGEIKNVDFQKRLLGSYFICFITFYVLCKSITSQKDINIIIIFIVSLGVLNGIVSALQFIGNSAAYLWATFLTPTELLEERIELYQSAGSGLGIGVIGLFGGIVKNGYLSSAFALLSLYMIVLCKSYFYRITFVLISLFLLFAVFLTQQRLVTMLSLIMYLYFFYRYFDFRFISLIFLLPIVGLFLWYFYNMLIESDSLGRLSNLEDEHRERLYSNGFQFVIDNFFFGGQIRAASYLESNGLANSAHNFVLNAFIYSGVFGAIFVIVVYVRMISKSVHAILGKNGIHSPSFFIGISLIVYLFNSLTHNSSLVSGDEYIWLLFAMLVKSKSIGLSKISAK